jgi:hypothetical protein
MKLKFTLLAFAVAIALGLFYVTRQNASHSEPAPESTPLAAAPAATPTPTSSSAPSFRIVEDSRAPELAAEVLKTTSLELKPTPKSRKSANASGQRPARKKPLPEAPEARYALSYVGADELAEEIWIAAINDPSLPPNERKDLIEDLNEDGFADPHHVTIDDLPLILSRLALIEEFALDAMDEVNAEAFAEAYKDLLNMADGLAQQ